MRIDDIKSQLDSIYERVRKLETHDPLGNASVSRGSTRFLGNESLKVIGSALVSGWLIVTGTIKIVGALVVEGVTTATGVFNINGPLNVNGGWGINGNGGINGSQTNSGALTQNGDWHLNGNGDIAGNVTQTGTYTVNDAGQIIISGATPLRLGATSHGPALEFVGAGKVVSEGNALALYSGDEASYLYVGGLSSIWMHKGKSISITATGAVISATLALPGVPTKSVAGYQANLLWIDPSTNQVYRTV